MINIGERIRSERVMAELTQKELAEKAGYKNYQTILNMENGQRKVKISDLNKISKALNLSMDYFLDTQKEAVPALWRDRKNEKECNILSNRLRNYLKNYSHLKEFLNEEYTPFVPKSADDLKSKYINLLNRSKFEFAGKLASDFRKDNSLGMYPADSLIKIIKELDILIFSFDLKGYGSAASLVNEHGAGILLNKENAPWRQYFDIAHELFHIITWKLFDFSLEENNLTDNDRVEKYANAFAASLLMPQSVLKNKAAKYQTGNNEIDRRFIIENAIKFNVSTDAFISRLEFLHLINKKQKKEFQESLDKIEYWKKAIDSVEHITDDEYPNEYLMLVYKAYTEERISKMKLAKYLNKNIGEIDHYLKKKELVA